MRPSFIAQGISGIISMSILIYMIYLIYTGFKLEPIAMVQVGLLLSIAIGVHGIQHFFEELHYNFNPLLTGEYIPSDTPVVRK